MVLLVGLLPALAAPKWKEVSANGTWPDPRYSHSAVVTTDGDMLIFGGNTLDAVNHLFAYSFARSEWTRIKPQGETPAKRYGHSAVALEDGRMLVFGGFNGSFLGDLHEFTPSRCDGDVCSPPTWQQLSCTGTPPCARDGHAALLLPDGRTMLVIGGFDGTDCFNDVYALDTESLAWRQITAGDEDEDEDAPAPAPRYLHAVAPCKGGFLMFGGYVDGKAPFQNDVWRFELGGAEDEADGTDGEDGEDGSAAAAAAAAPTSGVWRRVNASGTAPAPAFGHTAVADGAGRVFVFGGFGGKFSDELHVYTPAAAGECGDGHWARAPLRGERPSPRHKHSMVLSPQGQLVLFGGNDFSITRGLYELSAASAAAAAEGASLEAAEAGGLLSGPLAMGLRVLGYALAFYGKLAGQQLALRLGLCLVWAAEYPRVMRLAQRLKSGLTGTEPPLTLRGGGSGAGIGAPAAGRPGAGRAALSRGVRVLKSRR